MRASAALTSIAFAALANFVLAQDGDLSGPSTSQEASGYSCDPSKCQLPNCKCATTDIPGGLSRDDTPMFLVFTADDAVQDYTINAVNNLLAQRKNPNGCSVKMTYYTQISYTNFTLVTDWYVAGNEIADHTMTHPELGGQDEIQGNLIALNAIGGIPFSAIQGFRAPFLNYSADMLKTLAQLGFEYDSSATSSLPVTANYTDAFWPYTLDNGLANDCTTFSGICKGEPKIPGFWELPMYAIFDEKGGEGVHLMDPWLDGNASAVLEWMKSTFADHYNGNRQPFGLYTHPIHIATGYPGVADPTGIITMINTFLDWAQSQKNVWIVNNKQVLEWVKNPVKASDLNTLKSFQCAVPNIQEKICNGMPSNEQGLLSHCAFNEFPFYTCYGCPGTPPTPADPNPSQPAVSGQVRQRVPSTCDTPFWDPIGAKCLCANGTSCQFTDQTRPVGPNGQNLTGGGTGGNPSAPSVTYVPFNGNGGTFGNGALPMIGELNIAYVFAVMLGAVGMAMGALMTSS